jgi:competence protein ComEA
LRKVIHYIKQQLSLSYSEAKGFLSLLIICIVLLVLLFLPRVIIRSNGNLDPGEIRKLDSLAALFENSIHQEYFYFNPNVLSVDSLVLLGFPEEVALRLENYRSKGGNFQTKRDVKKIYGLSDELYKKIESYINLPDSIHRHAESEKVYNINTATPYDLNHLEGVENYLAERIIRYRDLLGGYIHRDQLSEVYQLEGETLSNIVARIFISEGFQPDKILINRAKREDIVKHPYISPQLADDIIRFREINGAIESEKLLANFKSIDKSNFKKLISYLDFH